MEKSRSSEIDTILNMRAIVAENKADGEFEDSARKEEAEMKKNGVKSVENEL